MNILLGQTYEIKNLISRKGKFSEGEFQDALIEIKKESRKYRVKSDETIITTTKSVELVDNVQILDVEILFPVNSRIPCSEMFMLKEKIKIVNALHVRESNIANLNNTMNQINEYILDNKLQPITTAYLVQIKQDNNIVTDIYIGINPNII